MPSTGAVDTSRMSVEQMRALSAEKEEDRGGKKKGEKSWSQQLTFRPEVPVQNQPYYPPPPSNRKSSLLLES